MSPDQNRKLAEFISNATRLPLISFPLFPAVGAASGGLRGVAWSFLCLFLTSGLSLVYLSYLTRTGKVRDPRRIPQSERVRPLRVVAMLHVGAFLVVLFSGATSQFKAVLLSYAISTALFALLTPVTNLSLHSAGVSGAVVCLAYVFGVWAAPSLIVLPLVWWARRVLGRHTPLELALGVLVGGGGTAFAFQLFG